MEDTILKKQVLDNLLKYISNISDENYQKRVWVKAEGPECDSFDELICELFPILRDVLKKSNKYELSNTQKIALDNFFSEIKAFSENLPESSSDEEIIRDARWVGIRKSAKDVLQTFKP